MTASVRAVRASGGKTISICSEYLSQGHNIHDFGNYSEVDVADRGRRRSDAAAADRGDPPRRAPATPRARAHARGAQIAAAHKAIREREIDDARYGWNAQPDQRAANGRRARPADSERRLGHRLGPPVHGHSGSGAC